MTERELISWIRERAPQFGSPQGSNRVLVGIGDDCAVYRPKAGEDLVFTTDFTMEDRHFTWADSKPHQAGWKAMARSLSDIAAMGAKPEFALVSLAASKACNLKGFLTGVFRCAKQYGVTIAGGDLTESAKLICDVMVAGSVPKGKAVLRSGAKAGDWLYVTGPMGQWRREPLPRLDLRGVLRRAAHAAIDVTDGLAMDLSRMLQASQAAARITADPPVDLGATVAQAWSEGESYELLIASPRRLRFPCIGQVIAGKAGTIYRDGQPMQVQGWDPFAAQGPKPVKRRQPGRSC
jgi:thiamine-monophosphate kinase